MNYAVALLFAREEKQAVELILDLEKELSNYSPYWAARAKMAELEGKDDERIRALQHAIRLSGSEQEIKHYQLQLQDYDPLLNPELLH